MFKRPENMVARSGMHTAAIKKQAERNANSSFRKLPSESSLSFFMENPPQNNQKGDPVPWNEIAQTVG
jgi:hypothetical protein